MSTLNISGATAGYGKVGVVHDIAITIPAAGRVALIGSNGAGKSTIVRALNGLIPLMRGSVLWGGQPVDKLKASERTQQGIATVPEGRLLFPGCTVTENLMVAATRGKPKKNRDENLARMFELFPRLRERASQRVGTLSGGEQQMVAIARALMTCPQLIILDEPSIGLAPRVVSEIFEVLTTLTQSGLSLLLVEQNVSLTLRSVDYGYVLSQGRIVHEGSAQSLMDDPLVRSAYLGQDV